MCVDRERRGERGRCVWVGRGGEREGGVERQDRDREAWNEFTKLIRILNVTKTIRTIRAIRGY